MLSFIWYGTNSIRLIHNDNSIMIDPFIRYDNKNDNSFINKLVCDNVLLTHGHIDHASDIKVIYKNKESIIYCTSSPYKRLVKDGIKNVREINYDDNIKINDFKIKVYKSKHIKFDIKLIFKTLFNKRVVKYFNNLIDIAKKNFIYKESNETVLYYMEVDNKKIMIMGSMNLDDSVIYPRDVDYLFLAFQGRSDLDNQIKKILDRINPKCVILTHFDDSFPPVSSNVNLDNIKKMDINLIIPEYDKEMNLI